MNIFHASMGLFALIFTSLSHSANMEPIPLYCEGSISGPEDIYFEDNFPLYLYKDGGYVFLGVHFFDELFIQANISDTHYRTDFHKIGSNKHRIDLNRITLSLEIASIMNDAGMLKFTGQCRAMPKPKL
jgi:hypothetical protein